MSISEVFIVNAAFSGGIVLFELPTGIIADTLGRRMSFLASVIVLCLTTIAYVCCPLLGGGFWAFCIVSVLMGLGFTFYSGAVEAWLVDALKATSYQNSLDKVFTRGSFVSGAAMLIGTVAGGFFGDFDLNFPYIIRAVLLLLVFFISLLLMKEIGYEPKSLSWAEAPTQIRQTATAGVKLGFQQPSMRMLIIAGAIQASVLSWIFYAWQPYFMLLLKKEIVWVAGVIAALISLSTMIGNAVVEWAMRFCGKRTTLLLYGSTIQAIAAIGIGITSDFYIASVCLLLVTSAMGLMSPVRQAYVHQLVKSEQRATAISFDAMIAGGASSTGQVGLGYVAQTHSYGFGYLISGVILAIAFPVLILARRLKDNADKILGSRSVKKGGCPAEGIPQISQIDGRSK